MGPCLASEIRTSQSVHGRYESTRDNPASTSGRNRRIENRHSEPDIPPGHSRRAPSRGQSRSPARLRGVEPTLMMPGAGGRSRSVGPRSVAIISHPKRMPVPFLAPSRSGFALAPLGPAVTGGFRGSQVASHERSRGSSATRHRRPCAARRKPLRIAPGHPGGPGRWRRHPPIESPRCGGRRWRWSGLPTPTASRRCRPGMLGPSVSSPA
jgi:hypothetical protein